jgi:hypothetical protein
MLLEEIKYVNKLFKIDHKITHVIYRLLLLLLLLLFGNTGKVLNFMQSMNYYIAR